MKILHFCESIARGGGIASFVANLTYEQAKTDSVSVCSIFQSNDNIELREDIVSYSMGKTKLGFSIKYPIRILRFLRKNHYDIVHIHSAFLYYALAVVLLHNTTTFVYTIHSDAVRENSSKWDRLFLWLKRWCFKRKWMHPVTISQSSKESFSNLYGIDSYLIYNGIRKNEPSHNTVSLSKFKHTKDTLVFVHPGRISEAKNQVVLCEAFNKIIDDGYDVVLLIAGTIQDRHIFEQLERFLCDRIVYIGQRNDVLQLMYEANAMCLASIWEGLPITLLEAMSVGCIPICTPVGGIVDVITDNVNGIIANATNKQEYYVALQRFLAMDKQQYERMKMQCAIDFERYNIVATSTQYMNYYRICSRQKNKS